MTKHILFKHPDLKYRKEDFGGIVKTSEGLFLIDKEAYKILNKIDNKKTYLELSKDKESAKIVNELLRLRIILKIDIEKANKIKNRKLIK